MTQKTDDKLAYTVGPIDEALIKNHDHIVSADPVLAATARLSRDLMNVMDAWLHDEISRDANPHELILAAMHGMTSVVGTVLINTHNPQRQKVAALTRTHLLEIYDAMTVAVEKEASKGEDQ